MDIANLLSHVNSTPPFTFLEYNLFILRLITGNPQISDLTQKPVSIQGGYSHKIILWWTKPLAFCIHISHKA